MEISVIIPVYRVEKTIERCVESVLRQDFDKWEIILVDDGSDDSSSLICDRYSDADKRITTIHQNNQGLGAARNTGIEMAKGKYIMFIDSDDYLGEGVMSKLVRLMDNDNSLDMLEFNFCRHRANGKLEYSNLKPETFSDTTQYFFKSKAYLHSYAWNKIYRREVFSEVRFTTDKKFEDIFTLTRILDVCRKISIKNVGYYHYIDNPQGITAKADSGIGFIDLLEGNTLLMERYKWAKPRDIKWCCFANYYAQIVNIQIYVYYKYGEKSLLTRRLYIPYTPKLAMVAMFGMKTTCRIFKTLYKICKRYH